MIRLSAAQARRIALAAQGFADPPPAGRVDRRHLRRVLGRVRVLQIDSVNVVARAHELPAFSRLGPYPRRLLTDLAYRHRELFEYWAHEASLVPIEAHPLLRWRMAQAAEEIAEAEAAGRGRLSHRPGLREQIEAAVAEQGPLRAADVAEAGERRGGWWGWSDTKIALEQLFWMGRVTAAGRGPNFERVYDVPGRILPERVLAAPTPAPADAQRALLLQSAAALGVATIRELADYFRLGMHERLVIRQVRALVDELVAEGSLATAEVEGWPEPALLDPSARCPRRIDAAALLAPFDPVVWERARAERLFGFRYRIEIYTPQAKRRYGYYVLPFLLGDRLVARVDLKADRQAGALLARAAHLEQGEDPFVVADALSEQLKRMAEWLELDRVETFDRGDLAPALRAALR